jgi:hypothetical protein
MDCLNAYFVMGFCSLIENDSQSAVDYWYVGYLYLKQIQQIGTFIQA